MAEIKKIRRGNDIAMPVRLKTGEGEVASIDITTIKKLMVYNDEQKVSIEVEKSLQDEELVAIFRAEKQHYLGAYRLVVLYNDGATATWDKPAVELVATTSEADEDTQGLVIVEISGELQVMSLTAVQEQIAQILEVSAKPAYIGENNHWYIFDSDAWEYVDSGVSAVGPEGPPGPAYDDSEIRGLINGKASKATTLEGYGIADAKLTANTSGMFVQLGEVVAKIPSKTSDLTNDSGFLTQHQNISGKADKTYVDTELAKKQGTITDLDTIRSGAAKGATALQSFTEADPTVPSFVKSITQAMINAWSGKQDAISDLATIRSGAAAGATALQSFTESDPTVPAHVKSITEANITSWNGKQNVISDLAAIRSNAANGNTAYGYFSGGKLPYSSLSGTPTIPAAVTEQTVSGWGFTKNTGTYSKPSGGIPKSDLSSDVQATLNKVDELYTDYQTALNLI